LCTVAARRHRFARPCSDTSHAPVPGENFGRCGLPHQCPCLGWGRGRWAVAVYVACSGAMGDGSTHEPTPIEAIGLAEREHSAVQLARAKQACRGSLTHRSRIIGFDCCLATGWARLSPSAVARLQWQRKCQDRRRWGRGRGGDHCCGGTAGRSSVRGAHGAARHASKVRLPKPVASPNSAAACRGDGTLVTWCAVGRGYTYPERRACLVHGSACVGDGIGVSVRPCY
jgi:hypothetical protein